MNYHQSEQLNELFTALSAAQGDMPDLKRNKTVKLPKRSYSYTTLDEVFRTVRPILAKHGLAVVQSLTNGEGTVGVVTTLGHKSGQFITGQFFTKIVALPSAHSNPVQDMGSTISYLRRYTLTAILSIAADEDTDATRTGENRQDDEAVLKNELLKAIIGTSANALKGHDDEKRELFKKNIIRTDFEGLKKQSAAQLKDVLARIKFYITKEGEGSGQRKV